MNGAKVEAKEASKLDRLKWLLVVLIIVAAAVGNYYYSNYSLLYRVIGIFLLGGLAVFVAISTTKGREIWQLIKDARMEVRKVVWPTKQETTQTTLVVIVFIFIAALILWGFDALLGWLTRLFIG